MKRIGLGGKPRSIFIVPEVVLATSMMDLPLAIPINHSAGYARLAGDFAGPMNFYDMVEKKDRSFPIKMSVTAYEDGVCFSTKFVFAAPRYSLSVSTESASEDGTKWIERGTSETLTFSLTNWSEFCAGTADWFEIQRPYISVEGPGFFRRRISVVKGGVWSEKWVRKLESEPWAFSHKMDLKLVDKK